MCDGIVLYTDGSFRQQIAGWGVHGYIYNDEPMTSKAATKQQPTAEGYRDVSAAETCTVIEYIDAFGRVEGKATNNTAELMAAVEGIKIALKTDAKVLRMYLDSEYVRKGLTQWIKKWIKNNWVKADQQPVANKDIWIELLAQKELWTSTGRILDMAWVEGHSGDMGNDKADINALRGGAGGSTPTQVSVNASEINKLKKKQIVPLVLETRLLFGINTGIEADGFYYSYNLGRMHNAGGRPRDTAKDKLAKADLLLGRRISEATFCVYKAKEPDEYFEMLIEMHTKALGTDNPELGIINLTKACNAKERQQIESMGIKGLTMFEDIFVLATPEMGLISKTLNPPRMANDAFFEFNILEGRLKSYLDGTLGEFVTKVDITDHFYETVKSGSKMVTQLKKTITQNTSHLDIPIKFKGKDIKIKLCLALDILSRNQLNRCACEGIKMEILVTPLGPVSYAYSTVIVTDDGAAIYSSPYTQFILK